MFIVRPYFSVVTCIHAIGPNSFQIRLSRLIITVGVNTCVDFNRLIVFTFFKFRLQITIVKHYILSHLCRLVEFHSTVHRGTWLQMSRPRNTDRHMCMWHYLPQQNHFLYTSHSLCRQGPGKWLKIECGCRMKRKIKPKYRSYLLFWVPGFFIHLNRADQLGRNLT